MNAKKNILILSTIILLATPTIACASIQSISQFEDPLGGAGSISTFLWNLISVVLGLSGLIALLGIVYGGFMMIVGGMRSDQDLVKGKQIILWSIIGLVIVGMSAVILVVVGHDLLGLGVVTL